MCDFREPPTGVQDIHTNELISCIYNGSANATTDDLSYTNIDSIIKPIPKIKDIINPGIYFICCTGGHYRYFDGTDWWMDRDDLGPLSNYPVPKIFNKYRFLFDETKEGKHPLCDSIKI